MWSNGGIRHGKMKNLFFILLLLSLFSSCNDILQDSDDVRVGSTIEEALLTSQIWKMEYFNSKPGSGVAAFSGAFLAFNTNNTFDLINKHKEVYTGQWALSSSKDLLVIRSDGKIPEPYKEVENEWIILNAEDDNIRIQERDPKGTEEFEFNVAADEEVPNVCTDITNLITDKKWRIQHLVVANSIKTTEYEKFEFTFDSSARAVATAANVGLEGSWHAGIRCNKFHLGFYHYTELNEISGLWQLSYFTESTIRLVMNREGLNWEMRLITGPGGFDNLCDEAESTLMGGSWTISKFISGNDSHESDFTGYFFQFKEEGKLLAFNNDAEYTGNWSLVDGCRQMPLTIEGNYVLDKINGSWQLVVVSNGLIKLAAEGENSKKEVQFVRDPGSVSLCESLDRMYEDNLTWHVTSYMVNNENLIERLAGVNILFSKDNSLIINEGNVKTNGTWALKDDCKKIDIEAENNHTENSEVISRIALEWNIAEATKEKIILVHESETSNIELQLSL